MCGILGYLNFNKELPTKKEFKTSLDLMGHRGPDGFDIFSDDFVYLGHRRLSIIDLSSAGKQPMCNEDQSIWITFNGEIYNYLELKKELEKKHTFHSDSDTEVLIHGFEEWDISGLLERINGIFAFGIWDSNKKELYLVRDHVGVKPLYYYKNNKTVIFASELKSISYFLEKKTINKNTLETYFSLGYIPVPDSVFSEIKKLPQASCLTITSEDSKIETYWKQTFGPYENDFQRNVEDIQKLLDKSVRMQLVADVPVGAFLSGGIDSSAVVATIKKYKENLHTFSIGFNDPKYDETKYAQNMADYLGTEHHTKILEEQDFYRLLKKIPLYYDEPFADSSQIPTMFVSELAKKYVTVSLSGDGGDELFGGYKRYYQYNKLSKCAWVLSCFRPALKFISNNKYKHLLSEKILRMANVFSKPNFGYFDLISINSFYNYNAKTFFDKFNRKDNLELMTGFDFNVYLPDDILTKVDRASMAFSLESRVPLLNYNLAELTYKIPSKHKIHNSVGKYIFKKALEDRVPKYNLYRNKMGFGVDFLGYLSNLELDYDIIKDFIKPDEYNLIVSNPKKHFSFYWALYNYQEWYKKAI